MAQSNGLELVMKTATCRRCGSTAVAWVKSNRTGNPYMVETVGQDGVTYAQRFNFHSNHCQVNSAASLRHERAARYSKMSIDELQVELDSRSVDVMEYQSDRAGKLVEYAEEDVTAVLHELRRRGALKAGH